MPKTNYRLLTTSVAGALLCGLAFAQQSSAPTSNPPASSPTATPKTQTSSGTKTGSATTAKKTPAPLVLKTDKDKQSYAIGMDMGKNLHESLKKNDVDLDTDIMLRGMKDALAGNKPLLTDDEAKAALTALNTSVRKHMQEVHEAEVAKNTQEGQAYLAANKDKPGVVTLPSGLQYKILQAGDGPKPTVGDTVVCNYKGTLVDGTEFDSSSKHGQPATFAVGQVIKGWSEALQLMPVGSKWELVIPSNLAYGERGTPNGPIGPNSTLVFEVELLSIQPKAPSPGGMPPGPKTLIPPAPQTQGQPANPQPGNPQPANPQSTQPQAQQQTQPPSQLQAKPQ